MLKNKRLIKAINTNPVLALLHTTSKNVPKISNIDKIIHQLYDDERYDPSKIYTLEEHNKQQDFLISLFDKLERTTPGILLRIFNDPSVEYTAEPKNIILNGITGRMSSLLINNFFKVYLYLINKIPEIQINREYDIHGIIILLMQTNIRQLTDIDKVIIKKIINKLTNNNYNKFITLIDSYIVKLEQAAIGREDVMINMFEAEIDIDLKKYLEIFSIWEYHPVNVNTYSSFTYREALERLNNLKIDLGIIQDIDYIIEPKPELLDKILEDEDRTDAVDEDEDDSLFTLFGGSNKYYIKYLKYKNKYLKLKNK